MHIYFKRSGGFTGILLKADLDTSSLPADEAEAIGLYHECVSTETVWARSVELADECAKGAPEAVQLTKRMLSETMGEYLATQLAAGAAFNAAAHTTLAAAEGRSAFQENRCPDWG